MFPIVKVQRPSLGTKRETEIERLPLIRNRNCDSLLTLSPSFADKEQSEEPSVAGIKWPSWTIWSDASIHPSVVPTSTENRQRVVVAGGAVNWGQFVFLTWGVEFNLHKSQARSSSPRCQYGEIKYVDEWENSAGHHKNVQCSLWGRNALAL